MDCKIGKRIESWFDEKTKLEKILMKTFIGSVSIATILIVTFFTIRNKLDVKECLTAACVQEASRILQYINQSIEPCDDFYQFACGGFLNNANIPEDKDSYDVFEEVEDLILHQMKLGIEQIEDETSSKPYHLLKDLYEFYMSDNNKNENLERIKTFLQELGGWPVLEGSKWNANNFSRMLVNRKLRNFGIRGDYFVTLDVEIDYKNSSRYVLTIDHPDFPMLNEGILKKAFTSDSIQNYYNFMVDTAILFGADRNTVKEELEDVIKFEMKLSRICSSKPKYQNFTRFYNPKMIKELQHRYPSIYWLQFITDTVGSRNFTFTNDDVVIIKDPQYLNELEKLLLKIPKRTQANFIATRLVAELIPFLNETFQQHRFSYNSKLFGQLKREFKWKECLKLTSNRLNLAASALYFKNFYNTEIYNRVKAISEAIRRQLSKIVIENKWLDRDTKKEIVQKVSTLQIQVGFPEKFLSNEKVEEFYENWKITSDNFLEAVKTFDRYEIDCVFRKLDRTVDKSEWKQYVIPNSENLYSFSTNTIQIPDGYLQEPFFNKDRPNYINYGMLGYLIGREIGRAFDEEGQQFDKNGNLLNYYSEEQNKNFVSGSIYYNMDMYAKEVALQNNLKSSLNEKVADAIGMKLSYLAYRKWTDEKGLEGRLIGTEFTPNQLFWISAANMMCIKCRTDSLLGIFYNPEEQVSRKLGNMSLLRNSEYFNKDFGCPLSNRITVEWFNK